MPFGFLALLAAFGTLANSLRSNSASVLIRTLLRCSARPNGGGIPHGSSASRTSPEWLVRFANFARMARPLRELRPNGSSASRTSPEWLVRFANFARMACSLRSHRGGWGCLISHASLLTRARHAVPLRQPPSFLSPHFSSRATTRVAPTPLTPHASHGHGTPCPYGPPPHSYDLTPHSSLLPPHSSLLTPHSSLLTPTTSLLTPHSYDLTPHSSFLTCIKLAPEAVGTLALCAPPRCKPLPPLRWPPPLYRICRIHRLYRLYRLQRFYRLRHPCHPTAMKP